MMRCVLCVDGFQGLPLVIVVVVEVCVVCVFLDYLSQSCWDLHYLQEFCCLSALFFYKMPSIPPGWDRKTTNSTKKKVLFYLQWLPTVLALAISSQMTMAACFKVSSLQLPCNHFQPPGPPPNPILRVRCALSKQAHRFLTSLSNNEAADDTSVSNRLIRKFVQSSSKSISLDALSHLLCPHLSSLAYAPFPPHIVLDFHNVW